MAKLRISNHMKWGREYEILYFAQPAKPSAEEAELIRRGKFPLTTGPALRQVQRLMVESEAIRWLGFHRQMSTTSVFASKKTRS